MDGASQSRDAGKSLTAEKAAELASAPGEIAE